MISAEKFKKIKSPRSRGDLGGAKNRAIFIPRRSVKKMALIRNGHVRFTISQFDSFVLVLSAAVIVIEPSV